MKRIHLIKLTPLHDREKKTSLQIRYRSSIPPNYKGDDILIAKKKRKKHFPSDLKQDKDVQFYHS